MTARGCEHSSKSLAQIHAPIIVVEIATAATPPPICKRPAQSKELRGGVERTALSRKIGRLSFTTYGNKRVSSQFFDARRGQSPAYHVGQEERLRRCWCQRRVIRRAAMNSRPVTSDGDHEAAARPIFTYKYTGATIRRSHTLLAFFFSVSSSLAELSTRRLSSSKPMRPRVNLTRVISVLPLNRKRVVAPSKDATCENKNERHPKLPPEVRRIDMFTILGSRSHSSPSSTKARYVRERAGCGCELQSRRHVRAKW